MTITELPVPSSKVILSLHSLNVASLLPFAFLFFFCFSLFNCLNMPS